MVGKAGQGNIKEGLGAEARSWDFILTVMESWLGDFKQGRHGLIQVLNNFFGLLWGKLGSLPFRVALPGELHGY